mgnify:CR=1 FL=1
MRPRRKQKVVLRAKVRAERWTRTRTSLLTVAKYGFICSIMAWGASAIYQLLYHSDFFMLKFVDIGTAQEPITQKISQELAQYTGQSTFRISVSEIERSLLQKHPALKSVSLSRSLPDRLKVEYELRIPAAKLILGNNPPLLVDLEGSAIPESETVKPDGLPILVAASSATVSGAVQFLSAWSDARADMTTAFSTGSLSKAQIDESGEISFYISQTSLSSSTVRVVWGHFNKSEFAEKFSKLEEVAEDLKAKSMQVSYISLREVPHKNSSTMEDARIAGKVVVRPVQETVRTNKRKSK